MLLGETNIQPGANVDTGSNLAGLLQGAGQGRKCKYLLSSEALVGVVVEEAHDQLLCLHR